MAWLNLPTGLPASSHRCKQIRARMFVIVAQKTNKGIDPTLFFAGIRAGMPGGCLPHCLRITFSRRESPLRSSGRNGACLRWSAICCSQCRSTRWRRRSPFAEILSTPAFAGLFSSARDKNQSAHASQRVQLSRSRRRRFCASKRPWVINSSSPTPSGILRSLAASIRRLATC